MDLATIDWGAMIKIIGIDIMLGADNAIVIALACATLPAALRNKGMALGTAGAVGLRGILLAAAGLLLKVPYVKLVAGAYLLFIGFKLLMSQDDEHNVNSSDNLWAAVKTIVIADFMMSLDNVLAVAGAAQSTGEHSTLYAVAGVMFSIPVIVAGATVLLKLMDRFPIIIWLGAGLLGWVGAEMIITDEALGGYIARVHHTMADWTHLSYKISGFVAVIFAVLAAKHFEKMRGDDMEEAVCTTK